MTGAGQSVRGSRSFVQSCHHGAVLNRFSSSCLTLLLTQTHLSSMSSDNFGIVFVGRTPPLSNSVFLQKDGTHWVLDATSLHPQGYTELKDVCLFLTHPEAVPENVALALYVSTGGSNWAYRGLVSQTHPSEVIPLNWPTPPDSQPYLTPEFARIGVSLESLGEAGAKEGSKRGAQKEFAKRVGLDLFNFMQSFGGVQNVGSNQLLVPANVLDAWYQRLERKLQLDPDCLTRLRDVV